MASEVESRPWPVVSMKVWPPDDTEESAVGTDLHQTTITNLRWGINEIARLRATSGEAVPWQALSQMIVTGFARTDGSRYKTLPDVFVYRNPIDQHRGSLAVGLDGPPPSSSRRSVSRPTMSTSTCCKVRVTATLAPA